MVPFDNACIVGGAWVDNNPVTEREIFSRSKRDAPITFWISEEVVFSKGVCGKEAVTTCMPVGGVPEITRMIKDSNANYFSFKAACVIYPVGWLAPDLLFAHTSLRADHSGAT